MEAGPSSAGPSSVEAAPVADAAPTPTDAVIEDAISAEELLQARWQAVEDQQAVNNIALHEYAQFDTVNIAFTVNGNREVETLRREDLHVFMDASNLMTDLAVKSVIW